MSGRPVSEPLQHAGESAPSGTADARRAGLCGVRVLDLGRFIAAPYCASLLADQGAEVIRVEPPAGSPDRNVMPIGLEDRGALYLQVNRNKKSLTLDITTPGGRAAFERLVARSDVVIVNLPPAALERAGLDYETLKALRQDIIVTTISALGLEGESRDRVGFDGTGQALSGAMYLTGDGTVPMRAAVSYVDFATAMSAAFATMSALYERARTGEGQHVQASLLGTALTMTNPMLIEEATGARHREPTCNRSPIAGPSDLFAVRDGWVMVQVIGDAMFARWAAMIGRPDLVDDPRYASDQARGENGEELSAIMAEWCAGLTRQECLARLEEARLPGCPALSPRAALAAPENVTGGFFRHDRIDEDTDKPSLREVPVVTGAIRTRAALSLQGNPAPRLGADSQDVLSQLGFSEREIRELTGINPSR